MHEAEQQSDSVITKLMQDGARLSDPAKVMAAMEADFTRNVSREQAEVQLAGKPHLAVFTVR